MKIPRTAQPVTDQNEQGRERPAQPLPIESFRDKAAWVLLGEPGAGKSTVLEMEATATAGIFLTAAELITTEPPLDEWRNRTLFIDALDETRAGRTESPLLKIKNQLRRLGAPAFRLSCRAADWHGESDRFSLDGLTPNDSVTVLHLCPLTEDDIVQLLHYLGVENPMAFVEQARRHRINALLENPQTLELLTKAIRDSQWPNSRADIYKLACDTLALEHNSKIRHLTRKQTSSPEQCLAVAGHICAILLLAGKQGIATDIDSADKNFSSLDEFGSISRSDADNALGKKLFTPDRNSDERLTPVHRTIAEYLAARWLAGELDNKRLPVQRTLNLLLGTDGGVVADLRGLYAWLAVCSTRVRRQLIEADPVSVALYGDARSMSVGDKQLLLGALKEKARANPYALRHMDDDQHLYGALATPELTEDFRAILSEPARNAASQTLASCALNALQYGGAAPELSNTLREVAADNSRWSGIRRQALRIYLEHCTPAAALELLQQIDTGKISDNDDDLLATLLKHLYPEHLKPDELLTHLHPPRSPNHIGSYLFFWDYHLPDNIPNSHIPEVLDKLCSRTELFSEIVTASIFRKMVDSLLLKGLQTCGEHIDDERLFNWLGMGSDEYGDFQRDAATQQKIAQWLNEHPDRYKAILARCILHQRNYDLSRLHGAQAPHDIGLWHLQQAARSEKNIAEIHLSYALDAFEYKTGNAGLSLEVFEELAAQNPELAPLLEKKLYSPLDNWRHERAKKYIERGIEQAEEKKKRTQDIAPHIEAIRTGTAAPGIFDHLAKAWLKHLWNIEGDTLEERFKNYSNFGKELMDVTATGFKQCPLRNDIPTIDETIATYIKQRRHFICQPCLLGMELRWADDPADVLSLPAETLGRMLAFLLICPQDKTPVWLLPVARQNPALVSDTVTRVASAKLKAGQTYIGAIHLISHELQISEITTQVAPALLNAFPLRAKIDQLKTLADLFEIALLCRIPELSRLIDNKLALKSIDAAQRVYWLAARTLLDPQRYEDDLWQYIGKSTARALLLADFFQRLHMEKLSERVLPPGMLGKLIEIIAPHAEIMRESGVVRDAVRRGDLIREMLIQMSTQPTIEASQELERLRQLPALAKLKFNLDQACHDQQILLRERNFRFLDTRDVAQVLDQKAPASERDMVSLALDLLDDIAAEIRDSNDDGYNAFWNTVNDKPESQRNENICRDEILRRLRPKLDPLGITADPEADHSGNKRSDIRLNYRNQFMLPIEIKRDSNDGVWTAIHKQLIDQYTREPKTGGHGIYLVLWFGEPKKIARALDGGSRPQSPEELQMRLEALLLPEQRSRIFIRVLDVSWPS